ncbi:MAG: 3-deoxy-7-phosphoheptulonate synthase class II [Rickettsiales bacterium]|nr:3-deoxy-7-phosphoheptulonate synthase class II [Rickettsiales bacterium]
MSNNKTWSPSSWRGLPIKQQPIYEDEAKLNKTLGELKKYPSLVIPSEIRNLKKQMAQVAKGKAFLLQGGDCAESFAEFNQGNLLSFFKVILQMTVALMYGAGKPVVKVGRIAGQFAKPRSADFEELEGKSLPSYRGDIVNNIDFTEESRKNNPENLLKAYFQSASTLNYLRALAKGGHASLRNVSKWNDEFIQKSTQGKRFSALVDAINVCQSFMKACGISTDEVSQLQEADFFISHEGLLLPYEEAFTTQDEKDGKFYATSAHLLWIGDRTRGLDDAHIEYFRGIENPIASKVGPSMKIDELLKLIDTLNPENEAGRLTLISRMGHNKVGENLPALVRAVKKEGKNVIWSCDPMHGNTIKSPNGIKTRPFNDILSEVRSFFQIHESEGTYAGGVHFEMTGQDVTECIGGSQAITEVDLNKRYHTHCDPRLNASQSLELAFLIAEEIKG